MVLLLHPVKPDDEEQAHDVAGQEKALNDQQAEDVAQPQDGCRLARQLARCRDRLPEEGEAVIIDEEVVGVHCGSLEVSHDVAAEWCVG